MKYDSIDSIWIITSLGVRASVSIGNITRECFKSTEYFYQNELYFSVAFQAAKKWQDVPIKKILWSEDSKGEKSQTEIRWSISHRVKTWSIGCFHGGEECVLATSCSGAMRNIKTDCLHFGHWSKL